MKLEIKNQNLNRPLCIAGFSALVSVILLMICGTAFVYFAVPVMLIVCIALCIGKKYKACKLSVLVSFILIVFSLLFAYHEKCVLSPSLLLTDQTVALRGTVSDMPVGKTTSLLLPLDNVTINGNQTDLKINLYTTASNDYEIGDTVYTENASIYFSAEDDAFYYHTISTGYWLSAFSNETSCDKATHINIVYKIKRFRSSITNRLIEALGEDYGGIAAALLIGNKNTLNTSVKTQLRICGASHLFAVSGMHLSIWTGIIFLILRKTSRYKMLPNIFASGFVIVYMILTGLSPSVMRAGIMLLFIFSEKLIHDKSDPLNSLGIAALLLLAHNVYLAGNVSFLLSFTATLGIVLLYPYFQSTAKRDDPFIKKLFFVIKNAIFLTFAAIAATAPISAYYFGTVSLLSPLSSLVCTLPVQIIMISSFLGLSFSFIPIFAKGMFFVCASASKVLTKYLSNFSRYDYFLHPVNPVYIFVWYAITALIAVTVYLKTRKKNQPVLVCLLLSATLLLSAEITKEILNRNTVEILIPANGNATSICIISNNNAYCALIGTGGSRKQTNRMLDTLNAKGIYHIDDLIIPRISNAENANTAAFLPYAKAVYSAENNDSLYLSDKRSYETDRFTLNLPNGFTYKNDNCEKYSAGLLYCDTVKIVISYYPSADFDDFAEELKTGDYLICRGDLPKNTDISRFANVIVLSDKTAGQLQLPVGIRSTEDTGGITIKAISKKR